MDLLPEDTIAPSHRNFITHIMKGTPLKLMFAHIFLRKDSPDQGRCAQAHCGYGAVTFVSLPGTDGLLLDTVAGPNLLERLRSMWGGIKDSY